MNDVRAAMGLYVDDEYIYKILTGKHNAPKITQAIREILGLSDEAVSP